jgi:hypothetical protein
MKKNIWIWQLLGFAHTALLGTVLHFLYDWLGKPLWIAPFSGVNESTWEHMKLIFWPMLIFALIQSLFFSDKKRFFCIKLRGILLGLVLIPFLFYGYNGIIGKSPDFINIAIFFVSAAMAYIYETRLFDDENKCKNAHGGALWGLLIISALFCIFTFFTPELAIFRDPINNSYGIK